MLVSSAADNQPISTADWLLPSTADSAEEGNEILLGKLSMILPPIFLEQSCFKRLCLLLQSQSLVHVCISSPVSNHLHGLT